MIEKHGLIYIVIPVHNRRDFTERCLKGLGSQGYKDFKVVVFDDGSSDGTAGMIKTRFPEVELLGGDGNCWWAESVNRGIEHALENGAEYVLLLNDDVVIDDGYIKNLKNAAEKNPEIIMGSAGYDIHTRELLYAGRKKEWVYAKMVRNERYPEKIKDTLIECDYLSGRGLWIPRSVFAGLGLFCSEKFPQIAADIDFTMRAKKAGYGLYCNMEARVYYSGKDQGQRKLKEDKTVKNFINYITNLKSAGNLKFRWRFIFRNCPLLYIPHNIILDTARVFVSYMR